jgi:hypothetical protein
MNKPEPADGGRPITRLLVMVAVILSLAACGLMLLVPTRSISVTTVYKGF